MSSLNLQRNKFNITLRTQTSLNRHSLRKSRTFFSNIVLRNLPVEEGLFALTVKPFNVVEVKIVSITMSWIYLQYKKIQRRKYESATTNKQREEKNKHQVFVKNNILTASSQCCKASFCALLFFDNPFPTCKIR